MNYHEILSRIAPCGLDCSRCAGFKGSEIGTTSARLLELLGGYSRLAGIRAQSESAFEKYAEFEEILKSFTRAECGGCRSQASKCPVTCMIRDCVREQAGDFCFQCSKYPCSEGQNSYIGERWQKNNDRMKAVGVENFYQEQAKLPRY